MNPDSGGHGEICTVGRNVFMGYIWEEGKTADAYTDDNDKWYRSGDIGRFEFGSFKKHYNYFEDEFQQR